MLAKLAPRWVISLLGTLQAFSNYSLTSHSGSRSSLVVEVSFRVDVGIGASQQAALWITVCLVVEVSFWVDVCVGASQQAALLGCQCCAFPLFIGGVFHVNILCSLC